MLKTLLRWTARRYLKEYGFNQLSTLAPTDEMDFHQAVGAGYDSNVIMTPVSWIARNFPAAPLIVEEQQAGAWTQVEPHALTSLVEKPNPHYTGTDIWDATIKSWFLDGNAYWIKVRDGSNGVAELWWVAPWLIEPQQRTGANELITHYSYTPHGAAATNLLPENVVHFRAGIDPNNPRKGCSVLKTIIREVFTDDEASRYTSFLLKNMGVPGLVVRPKDRPDHATIADADILKKQLVQRTTGAQRGKPMVMTLPLDVTEIGMEPRRMDLSALRNVSEERACAAVGVPPAVVHFGTGLQQTKVGATMKELRADAWASGIIPMQRRMADQLELSLLSELDPRESRRCRFATEEIPAMQEDADKRATRNVTLYQGGVLKRSEARADLGWDVAPDDDGYKYELEPAGLAAFGGKARTKEDGPSDAEAIAIATGRRRKPTDQELDIAKSLEAARPAREASFVRAIKGWAGRFGEVVGRAASENLKQRTNVNGHAKKNAETDAEAIMRDLDLDAVEADLKETYTEEFIAAGIAIAALIGAGLGANIESRPEAQARLAAARSKFLDLPKQTRKRIAQEIQAGLDEGLEAEAIAKRLEKFVPAGPYKTIETRAAIIARTEVMAAEREAAVTAYKDSGIVVGIMVYDNLTGFGDAECTALDGMVVPFEAADELAASEHPNGTRYFGPAL